MAKRRRSPWEHRYERERAANATTLNIMLSAKHMCLCGHAQGFHWKDEHGENVGECAPSDCVCKAFDEDVLYEARRQAELRRQVEQTRNRAALSDETDDDGDALLRAVHAQEEHHDVSADEAWDQVLHVKRPNPARKPRPDTSHDRASTDTSRELGGSTEDLTG